MIPKIKNKFLPFLFIVSLLSSSALNAKAGELLWQIGKADNDNAEFALASDQYKNFSNDGLFVVGRSDTKTDWPYVQPGTSDSWAGSRPHPFTILFGIKNQIPAGECHLQFDLLDTQNGIPPELLIQINGNDFQQKLPAGSGDASIFGQPSKGKEFKFAITFPSDLLKKGENVVTITTVSGSWFLYDSLSLETPDGVETDTISNRSFVTSYQPIMALTKKDGKFFQPVRLTICHIGNPEKITLHTPGIDASAVELNKTIQDVELWVPAVEKETEIEVTVESGGKEIASKRVKLEPVKKLTVYIVPHSHTDIGYTEIQTAIEDKQVKNLETGIEYARKTADYPEGSRFIWNVEVPWAADLYLQRMPESKRNEFYEAVKKGWVGLNGMYLNELTGLCRPEELLQLFKYSTQLADHCGVTIDSAMISDVPGYTWGTVTAMAQAGIKYFSTAPNYFDRIGDILVKWENKPFYWISPSGKEKVLVWIPYKGYALSHIINQLSAPFVQDYMAKMVSMKYPYDIAYLRWSGHGDNAVPDMTICDFIKDWNSKYEYPKFIISTTSIAFKEFEKKYGSQLPEVRGDWTPYWEDGAGSSAFETAQNRASSDRLSQAETLWAMLNPKEYPAPAFEEAWKNVLLYSEHTWGAWCSVSDPENKMTKEQWDIKKSYATEADLQTKKLLESAFENRGTDDSLKNQIDVYNTSSWLKTGLVILSREQSLEGDQIIDERGNPIPSQRLSNGTLAFVANSVPPFVSNRYALSPGNAFKAVNSDEVRIEGNTLINGFLRIGVDPKTGGIVDLYSPFMNNNFADGNSGYALNDYLYLTGDNVSNLQRTSNVKITVKEKGPLVASLVIESEAPGCNKLTTEIRLVTGFDYVEITNTLDKKRSPANPKPGDWQFAQKGGKESVNFAYPFAVKDGVMRLDIPLGIMQPEIDQMPSACKNWFTIGRWADVSNNRMGITWASLDAPLVEVGELSAIMLGSQANPDVWRKKVEPTQTLFSWAMNNHWGTNYRAYQEGTVVFRYALRPHHQFESDSATRFATGLSQPLIAVPAAKKRVDFPCLRVVANNVTVISYKLSNDGKAWILRLFGTSEKEEKASIVEFDNPRQKEIWLSNTTEKPLEKVEDTILVPAGGIVTVRVELPK